MKKAKLLAATVMPPLTSCSPKVVINIVRTYPDIIPADSAYVISLGKKVLNTVETIGRVPVMDRGTLTNCRYDQVLHLAQETTGKIGGGGLAITNHQKPSFWGSSCHQISGLMLRLSDKSVGTLKTNLVQDIIDLGLAITKDYAKSRETLVSTFEASFGYGWATGKIYDVSNRVLNSRGGTGQRLAHEHVWGGGMGIGLQYAGFKKPLFGGDMMFSYIAPEWVNRTKLDGWILRPSAGADVFFYHDPFYSVTGFDLRATLGFEYMPLSNWRPGLTPNGVDEGMPK